MTFSEYLAAVQSSADDAADRQGYPRWPVTARRGNEDDVSDAWRAGRPPEDVVYELVYQAACAHADRNC